MELIWVLPFIALLGAIAIMPLANRRWWETYYPFVSAALGAIVIARYFFFLGDTQSLAGVGLEYVSFICLIGSLFVVSGGIHISVKGEATPAVNTLFLAVGALVSNVLGTTGASMVMIRPWLRMNKYRLTAHHIVFFIFVISNVGGALTPIGDPPLFLGYLQGIPFFWVLRNMWPAWLLGVGLLLAIFFVIDTRNFRKAPAPIREKETAHEEWRFSGLPNIGFLAVIIGAVFIQRPPLVREAIMIAAAVLSYKTTPKAVHERNDFSFAPIQEVAILFFGIFATMIPALQWLEHHSGALGIKTAGQFFWATGSLSSALDNAPTYLSFLSAAMGLFSVTGHEGVQFLLAEHPHLVRAISVGAVFFGAMTYIGNGPNFLVKSIADKSGANAPHFLEYVYRFALPILLPVFFLTWWIFFKTA